MVRDLIRRSAFHPILLAIYWPLLIYLVNLGNVEFHEFIRMAVIVLIGTLAAWIIIALVLRNIAKAAVIISTFLFLFFSFGYLLSAFALSASVLGYKEQVRRLVEPKTSLLIWSLILLVIFIGVIWEVVKERWDIRLTTYVLNIVSVTLVASSLVTALAPLSTTPAGAAQNPGGFSAAWASKIAAEPCLLTKPSGQIPDIYYVILDSYGRDDVLRDLFAVDNSQFISFLTDKGFFVARDARANYRHTALALRSYLNYDYHDNLASETGLDVTADANLATLIKYNRVFHQLRCIGYKVHSFSTGFAYTQIDTADQLHSPPLEQSYFESILIDNTPLRPFMLGQQYDMHRDRIRFELSSLPELARLPGPKFVFVHVFAPHPPFVFGAAGEPVYPPRQFSLSDGPSFLAMGTKEEYLHGYHDQILALNKLVEGSVEGILNNSSVPPIIIIQGDHGPASEFDLNLVEKTNLWERFSILSAYYLPDIDCRDRYPLYPGITPVNTFRVIFNTYFGANLKLLEDRSYYSPDSSIYQPIDVTDRIRLNRYSSPNAEPLGCAGRGTGTAP